MRKGRSGRSKEAYLDRADRVYVYGLRPLGRCWLVLLWRPSREGSLLPRLDELLFYTQQIGLEVLRNERAERSTVRTFAYCFLLRRQVCVDQPALDVAD